MKHSAILAVLGLLSSATIVAQADESPLFTTDSFAFSVFEVSGDAVAITSTDQMSLSCLLGESVTMTAPDGMVTALSAVDDACVWTPTVGGMWTASNSLEGEALLTVRYSLFPGSQGAGTVADPIKIVDNDEVLDLFNGGGMSADDAFSLCGPYGVGTLELPAGYAADGAAEGVYRLVAASGGLLYGSLPVVCLVDSAKPGPNRSVRNAALMPPFAYSGDGWLGSDTATATLEFYAPNGVVAKEDTMTGCGVYEYAFPQHGSWTVVLSMDDGTELVSNINFMNGFVVIMR